jgi:hypothetical protein
MMGKSVLDVLHYLPTVILPRNPLLCFNQPKAVSSNKGSHLVSLPVGLRVIVNVIAKSLV